MLPEIRKVAGLHPGFILKREMHKRSIELGEMASILNMDITRISAFINGTGNLDIQFLQRLADFFEMPLNYFTKLQEAHDLKTSQKRCSQKTPNLKILRKILFWDTDINLIKWEEYKGSVIRRVFQRGNFSEKKEIVRFYGPGTAREFLNKI